jgi:hypothetical protein
MWPDDLRQDAVAQPITRRRGRLVRRSSALRLPIQHSRERPNSISPLQWACISVAAKRRYSARRLLLDRGSDCETLHFETFERKRSWSSSHRPALPVIQGKEERRVSHTLCTCGADAPRAERGYPIGMKRFFSGETLFTRDVKSMTARCAIWQNAISDKDLRARSAITAKDSVFCSRTDLAFAWFAGRNQGWQRCSARPRTVTRQSGS